MQTLVNRLTAIIDDYTERFNRFTAAELVQVHLPCAAAYACQSVWQNLCNGPNTTYHCIRCRRLCALPATSFKTDNWLTRFF